ncbi:TonB-dependent siderophore receptor [Pseudoduganella lutea]|uniref:TonB-dependent siderophore receptor n=1 Tax=Pseudoduganella lutea TaxID=321985 RepID=A0A4P6KTT4_9BURK|nr:TonB-dependent siderophore receptor [Pseudoduganella lutea]QBE62094.1 TonB-dependent siderophore receptor [Pseudoduganella lutea]
MSTPSSGSTLVRHATTAAILGILPFWHAQAQTVPQTAPATMAEIEVTGTKDATTENSGSYTTTGPIASGTRLDLSPRETPQSLSIVTRERMEQQGLQTLAETMQQVTGLYVNYNDTERVTYNARGYAVTNFQVDGMLNLFGSSLKANGDNVVYDRIEVVRGATGLTTGAGDPSATINQVRKRPTREFQANAALRIGSYDLRRAELDVSGPLAFDGKLRGRFVTAKQKAESFRPMYEQDMGALYGILEADLGAATTVAVGYERQKSDPRGSTWGTVPYWNADGSLANLPSNLNLSTPWASWNMDEKKTFATLEHRFADDWRLRAAWSRTDRVQDGSLYFGYGGYPRADGSGITVASNRFPVDETMDVLELNVDGKFDLFGRRHDIVFGWGKADREMVSQRVTIGAVPAGYDKIPNWQTWTGDVPQFPTTVGAVPNSIGNVDQKALSVATRLNLTDALKAVVGLRHGDYTTRTRNFNADGSASTTTGFTLGSVNTPYVGLLYDLDEQWTAYTAYTSIFQPQNLRDRNNEFLDPVDGNSIEAGIKAELFDRRVNFSAAVFRSEKDNVGEIDDSVPPNSLPGAVQAYRSTGKGNKVDGFELEASGQVLPEWNLSAGYSHTRSRDARGNPINTVVPRNLLKVFTTYRFGPDRRYTVGGGVNWQSNLWNTAQQPTGAYNADGAPITAPSRISQGSIWLASLTASYRINDHFTASVNVANLFDKTYYNRVGFYNGLHYAEPRTASATLRAVF